MRIVNVRATEVGPFNGEVPVQCTGRDDSAALTAAVTAANGQWVAIGSGQTCAGGDITIPNLRIEKGGLLKPITAKTITLSGAFDAGRYQTFTNALPGQGTISFAGNTSVSALYPQWWATNTTPGTTDMTAAAQAAITATGGRARVHFPTGSYLITATLKLPALVTTFSPLVIDGDGPFLSNLINKASAGKPTLLIDRDLVIVKGLGFWGNDNLPNDGIKVYQAHRVRIENCEIVVKGSAITLQEAHSIFIQNNFGQISGGTPLMPAGVTNPIKSFGATDSFVYVNIPTGGFANHIVIRDNINESYGYQVHTVGAGYGFSWVITGNQFEGSTNGFKLDNLNDYEISGNYLGEGGTGYSVDMSNCRRGRLGPNYIHFQDFDSKMSTVKLHDVLSTVLMGNINRLYLTGSSIGLVAQGAQIDRLQDETSDHLLSMDNCVIGSVGVPLATLNMRTGRAAWYSDSTSFTAYPTVRLGDQVLKATPVSGASPGWVATTASSAGALVQVTGSGPNPVVLNDYAAPTAYDFRITMVAGGVTGTATYKVEWKAAGGGVYADLTNTTTTTELAHLIKRETGSGPLVTFSIRWPTAQTYVAGNRWTLTAVVPPAWTAISWQ